MAGPLSANKPMIGQPTRDRTVELTGAAEAIERLQKAADKVAADAEGLKSGSAKTEAKPVSIVAPAGAKSFVDWRSAAIAGAAVAAIVCAALLGARSSGERFEMPEIAALDRIAPWKPQATTANATDGILRKQSEALTQELQALRTQLGGQSDQLQSLQGEIARLKSQIGGQQAQAAGAQSAATTQMTARLDKIERETSQRMERQTAQIERLERLTADPVVTNALQKTWTQNASTQNTSTKNTWTNVPREARNEPRKPAEPALGPGEYRLRGVRDGVATIQTHRGLIEVVEGDRIPGLGRVRSVEKVRGRWVVRMRDGIIDAD
jgi:hypothetical protein